MSSNPHYRSRWVILFIILLTSVAAPLNMFKVPPVLPLLMDYFRLSAGNAGSLMSVFALSGLLLAIPVGYLSQRLGYRMTGLIGLFSLIMGAGMGAFSQGAKSMLLSRFIEGIGMSLIAVSGPAMIALWFKSEQRGRAMGIWSTWLPIGSTLMFMIAPQLAIRWTWREVWWFGCLFAFFVGILYFLFVKTPPDFKVNGGATIKSEKFDRGDLKVLLRNRDLWLISILFFFFDIAFISFLTWTPTFLYEVRGMSLPQASFLVSLIMLIKFFSHPFAGWISDKVGSRKLICVVPMLLLIPLFPLTFSIREEYFFILIFAFGIIGGCVPTGIYSAGSEVLGDERLGGMAMGILQTGQNAGILLGPLMFGWVVEFLGGWQTAFWVLAPISAIGGIAAWITKMK